jgi:hypothetical protein
MCRDWYPHRELSNIAIRVLNSVTIVRPLRQMLWADILVDGSLIPRFMDSRAEISSRYASTMPARHRINGPTKPKRRSAPYPFIVEALAPLEPEVRVMFSGFAVYVGDKIVLMLRDSRKQPEDNGVWLVFAESTDLADPRIRKDFPSIRLIKLLGGKIAHWRLIPADSPTFESEALHACELLLKRDGRFGRIPQSRKTRPAKQRRK